MRVRALRAGILALWALGLAGVGAPRPAQMEEPRRVPRCTIRRVVPQRPAFDGAFAPDGRRFAFVHKDQLWLGNLGNAPPRRIGAPRVSSVYRARWATDSLLLVNHVTPGAGDALATLDLSSGRFRPIARPVEDGSFDVSRRGALAAWGVRASAGTEWWAGFVMADRVDARRLGLGAVRGHPAPSPDGGRLAGVSAAGKPFIHRFLTATTEALPLDPGETALAASWSPDGGSLACLARVDGDAPGTLSRVVVYGIGRSDPLRRRDVPAACEGLFWDAAGEGVLCLGRAPERALWYVPVHSEGEALRIHPGPVPDAAAMAGGCVLAAVGTAGERGTLYLLNTAGTLEQRLSNTPGFDRISDVSADGLKALVTRAPHDDRGDLHRQATLWAVEIELPNDAGS